MQFPISTIEVSNNIRIHAISTGSDSVKNAFRTRKGKGFISKLYIGLDNTFTEYMPIWVWVIEHPEGIFVIDTGENSRVNDAGYYRCAGRFIEWVSRTNFKFKVAPEEEIGPQLLQIGIKPEDVKKIILTHLHQDHTDGLSYFPNTEIIINRPEFEKPENDIPCLYPKWFTPTTFDYIKDDSNIFGAYYPVTQAEDLLVVPTPGHTRGHSSIILKTETAHYFFAGDTSISQAQMLKRESEGANSSLKQTLATYDKILEYARLQPTIYLPSHDADVPRRLEKSEILNS